MVETNQAQGLPQDTNLVEVVTYLASLASNPREIDPILDTLRIVTARMKGAPSDEDARELRKVWQQLEDYLVTQEKVRAFTREDLQQRIQHRFHFGGYLVKRAKKLLLGLLLATPLCVLAIFIPQPAGLPADIAEHFSLLIAICLTITWLYVIAALLFALGLGSFQRNVKRAYAAICSGTVFMGLSVLQLPVIVSLGWLDSPFFETGGFMTLHVISITVLFTGVCLFARELGNKNMGRIAAIMLFATATIAIIGGLLAGALDAQDATPIGRFWVLTLSALCAGVV